MGGSSAKRKKEKKKDFQKPKLKVGKARPKNTNATDTSFRAKAITLAHQSLATNAPTQSSTFLHALSLLTSKSDSQRKDSLSTLTNALTSLQHQRSQPPSDDAPTDNALPRPASEIISRLRPLLLDSSRSIRTATLDALRLLPAEEVERNVDLLVVYVHIGLTHLSSDIRSSTVDVLEWLCDAAGPALVGCKGGWTGTLRRIIGGLGWITVGSTSEQRGAQTDAKAGAQQDTQKGWSSTPRTKLEDSKLRAKQMSALARLLEVGLRRPAAEELAREKGRRMVMCFPLRDRDAHMIGSQADPYARLNLFADEDVKRGGEDVACGDWMARLEVYREGFAGGVEKGVVEARKEGGEIGRAAKMVEKALGKSVLEGIGS